MASPVTLPGAAQRALQRSQRRAGMTTRAWTATRKLQTMLPMLERYARAVLRDPNVQVHSTHQSSSYTDGKNVYIQPPMRLGDNLVHMVGSCGTRGENKRLVCPACDVEEVVMSLLYHEVSHLAFGSFVSPEKLGRKALASLVVEWHPPQACDHGIEILEAMAKSKAYLEMAHHFDDRLPLVMNGLEDARVNASMLKVRPGTRVMLDARTHDVFTSDIPMPDGSTMRWGEMPIEAQVSVGMLLAASDYHEHIDSFREEAKAILADEVLVKLARNISTAKSAHELAVHTAAVWRRFQDLGIMVKEKCVPPPPEDDEDQDDQDQDDQEPQPDEDAGEQPDIGSLGNEGQPSPSDGDGEGGSSSDDDKKEDDGADSSGDQRQSDPTSSPGAGSSSAPGKGAGEDQRESGMSNKPDEPDEPDDQEGSGGGDRVQDERDSGSEDDLSSDGSSSSDDDDEGRDADGSDQGERESDGGQGDTGEELTDGEAAGQESEGEGDEGGSDEPASAKPEGEAAGDSERPGEDAGTVPGADGGTAGGGAGGAEEAEGVRDGGPDEADKPEASDSGSAEADSEDVVDDAGGDPADFTPATLEELTAAIQAGSLHELFEDESTDNFASGHSVLNQHPDPIEAEMWAAALLIAAMQAHWFEGPSEEVGQVRVIQYGENLGVAGYNRANVRNVDLTPSQAVVGPVVNKGRIAFSPNKRNRYETGLKSGKVNPRALRRIPGGAEDLFRKKHVAAKRSYHVIITMDVSGSTASAAPSEHFPDQSTLEMMQRSVFAQAEALARLNISFEIWAHTADWFMTEAERLAHFTSGSGWGALPKMDVWLLQVKQPGDKWDADARQRMHALRSLGGNLDGHTLQIMRKRADEMKRRFTDVIICYYTDGAMPASNAVEEGKILKEETALCKRKGYPLLAVAAGTDSPKAWGFDTVTIDSDRDLPKVMEQLERTIM